MSNYKTECPRCHTVYPMPDSKLNEPKARANCGKCGHTFYLNLHIIDPKTADINSKLNAKAQATPQVKPQVKTQIKTQQVATNTQARPTPTKDSQSKQPASDVGLFADDPNDKIAPPKIPIKKKKPVVPTEGMIFDDMAGDDVANDALDFDGLDDFMKQEVVINKPVTASSKLDNAQQNGSDDEAWLDDLLKNDDSPAITTKPLDNRPSDDFSDILGEDYTDIIPIAHQATIDDPKAFTQRAETRLAHNPSQEQLAKKRSVGLSLLWVLGCLMLVGLLFVQYVIFNADTIAKTPQKAGIAGTLCGVLPCPKASADIGAFSITHTTKPSDADHATDIIAIMQNTSGAEQLYPNLKITLNGNSGIVGEAALTPADYLTNEQRLIAPATQKRFMLTFDVDSSAVKSITIEPFY